MGRDTSEDLKGWVGFVRALVEGGGTSRMEMASKQYITLLDKKKYGLMGMGNYVRIQ